MLIDYFNNFLTEFFLLFIEIKLKKLEINNTKQISIKIKLL